MTQKRAISVFISSTFQDMQNERDMLLKYTFKELRHMCECRGISWNEIDLRWGITEEEATSGKVLPLCFYAIDKSRPYFICMIGGRYGTTLDEKPESLIKKEIWLEKCWDKCSITELEIMYGVLQKPELAKNAYFYFKNTNYPASASENKIFKTSDDDLQRIENLKGKIRLEQIKNPESITITPYNDANELNDIILLQISKLIDKQFPISSTSDTIDLETQNQEYFADTRKTTYYHRPHRRYEKRIAEAIENKNTPLVITGESGSGKTSLIANWLASYKTTDSLVIKYFVGVTSKSTSCNYMLNYLIWFLKKELNLDYDVPSDFNSLKTEFIQWLERAGKKRRIILVIDALNQLDNDPGVHTLSWLPQKMPEGITLIVSSLHGDIYDMITKYNWNHLNIDKLTNYEKTQFIKKYLIHYHKKISDKSIEKIAQSKATENPLFLCSLLEELRLFGDYDNLPNKIIDYLAAKDITELFEIILRRWETDYGIVNKPNIISEIFTAIWASRKGLTVTEICDFLKDGNDPLPHIIITRLLYSTEKSLMFRGDVINYSHDFIRMAVEKKYLPTEDSKNKIHLRLAKYFESSSDYLLDRKLVANSQHHNWKDGNIRKLEELPWQLMMSKQWHDLIDYLKNPDFFTLLWNYNSYDLRLYWSQIENSCKYKKITISQAYQQIINNLDDYTLEFKFALARLFELRDNDKTAYPLYIHLKNEYQANNDCSGYASILGKIGWVLSREGKLKEAKLLYEEQEKIARSHTGNAFENILQISLNYQALLLLQIGNNNLDVALKLLEEKESICRKLGNYASLHIGISNRGMILYKQGKYDEALTCFKEEENICNIHGFIEGLHISYGRQSMYYQKMGDYNKAFELQIKKEQICRDLKIDYGLATSLATKGQLLLSWKRYDEAKIAFDEGLKYAQKTSNKDAEIKCVDGLNICDNKNI